MCCRFTLFMNDDQEILDLNDFITQMLMGFSLTLN